MGLSLVLTALLSVGCGDASPYPSPAGPGGGGGDVEPGEGAGTGPGGGAGGEANVPTEGEGEGEDPIGGEVAGGDTTATEGGGEDAENEGGGEGTEDEGGEGWAGGGEGDPIDLPPPEGCDDDERVLRRATMPLGDTLFLTADDYLAFLKPGEADLCGVDVGARPEGAGAEIRGAADNVAGRLTPDKPGNWLLRVGAWDVRLEVRDERLTEDTFLNYNYTPVFPLAPIEGGVLVATPTSNAVQHVRWTDSGAEAADLIPTGGWPTSVVVWPGSRYALVAQTGRDSLGFLDIEAGRIVDAIHVGNEPAGIIVDADHEDGPTAWVSISGDDMVVKVDLQARTVVGSVSVGRDPRALAYDRARGRLFAASLLSQNAHPRGRLQDEPVPLEDRKDIAVIDATTMEVTDWVHEAGTMLRGLHLNGDATRLLVAVSHSRNDAASIEADSRPHAHALVVVDVDPASGSAYEVLRDIDLDRRGPANRPAPSPFTMAMTPDGSQLLMTLSAGKAVMALDPDTLEEIGRQPLGDDPRGLVFAGGKAWTTAWLSDELQGFDVPIAAGRPSDLIRVPVGDDPTPADIRNGQRIFNDAAFSRHGDFSCNNCHIDGVVDGLTWDLLVDGNVNTLAFRNVAGTNPFLWGGLLPTLFDFSREVLKLVGADATGQQMEDLTRYMQSVTAPPNPYALPGGRLSESALLGKDLFFDKAGCGGCHSGPLYTSQTVERGKTPDLLTDVPALIGVYDSRPYGREGQWQTLEDMVDYAVDFTRERGISDADLTDDERDALLQYVREIPGDALYLNAARPLSGDRYARYDSPVELTFSEILKPDQEELFTLVTAEDGEPVGGSWEISGRVARFTPEQEVGLDQETEYEIEVEAGLGSGLGRTLYESLVIEFRTGGEPAFDTSGQWRTVISVENPVQFSQGADIAIIQSVGGHLTGVILSSFDEGSLSHINGSVSGTRLQLDPFIVEVTFGGVGPVTIDGGWAELQDTDGDGFADTGVGEVTAFGFIGLWTLERESVPGQD